MVGERTKPDEVELGLDEELPRAVAPRIAVHLFKGRAKVFSERHRAKERARLKKHSEARHALVKVRLADAVVDVDAPGLGPLRVRSSRSSVLLPLPDPPGIAKIIPRSTWKVMCSRSTRVPQPARRSSAVIMALLEACLDTYECVKEREQCADHNH